MDLEQQIKKVRNELFAAELSLKCTARDDMTRQSKIERIDTLKKKLKLLMLEQKKAEKNEEQELGGKGR